MSEFIVVGFDDMFEADRVLSVLLRLEKEYLIDLEDAVVAVRRPNGAVTLKQSVSPMAIGTASGLARGALWGGLIGLLFLAPVMGIAVGGIAGAGVGALAGSAVDYGIDDNLIAQLASTLKPDSSALFLLVRKAQPEKVLAEFSQFKGRIIRTSLSPEQEKRLEEALASRREAPQPVAA
ncbi:MAG: DUF1269 domain-containing protein [Bauldia sp.]|nr:DUF1269 domain-containing protein [Bauldia sp.]MCW5717895.1 DUF1269 domain-containing protein [Bauldia sp.]